MYDTTTSIPNKYIGQQILSLNSKVKLEMSDLVSMACHFIPLNTSPTFLFAEIIKSKQSFIELDQKILQNFVEQIVLRSNHDKFTFEHLLESKSRIHSKLLPYTEMTLKMVDRIVTDLLARPDQITCDQVVSLCQLLGSEPVLKNLFNDHTQYENIKSQICR